MDTNTILKTLGGAASAFGPWGQAIGAGLSLVGSVLPDPQEAERKRKEAALSRMSMFAGGTPLTQDTLPEQKDLITNILRK
jgi:hypothetical protein